MNEKSEIQSVVVVFKISFTIFKTTFVLHSSTEKLEAP